MSVEGGQRGERGERADGLLCCLWGAPGALGPPGAGARSARGACRHRISDCAGGTADSSRNASPRVATSSQAVGGRGGVSTEARRPSGPIGSWATWWWQRRHFCATSSTAADARRVAAGRLRMCLPGRPRHCRLLADARAAGSVGIRSFSCVWSWWGRLPEDAREDRAHVLTILELDVDLSIGALGLDNNVLPTKIGLHLDHISDLNLWPMRGVWPRWFAFRITSCTTSLRLLFSAILISSFTLSGCISCLILFFGRCAVLRVPGGHVLFSTPPSRFATLTWPGTDTCTETFHYFAHLAH
mmetsp:Transcript_21658/g.39448  ORF Transcript_21658/g.39448 Transcript_21658/m.39448 type:complete len:300 (-) Transcript_21658:1513-2412(-)